jgi:hypothetical protein
MKIKIMYLILGLLLMSCDGTSLSEQIGKDFRSISDDFNKGFKPAGSTSNTIGMSATIIYLQETNQIDSVSIDLFRLLQIQDSINSK